MDIGKKLKEARVNSGMSQEKVAEEIQVSRQTISNWENEKSYPDIVSVLKLSDLYAVSLDVLLKGDVKMIEHLEESTNIVKSSRHLITAVVINILAIVLLIVINGFLPENMYLLAGTFCIAITCSAALFYQIIKRF